MLLFQLISAKIAAEHHEEKRRQVSAELTAETETLKERLLLMESCQSELEAVQKRSLEIEMTAKNLQNEKMVMTFFVLFFFDSFCAAGF